MIIINTEIKSNRTQQGRIKGEVLVENILTVFKGSEMDFTYEKACIFLDVVRDCLKNCKTNNGSLVIDDDPFKLKSK